MNSGIDYGLGRTNVDEVTGIRYGCLSQHSVMQAWADSSEAYIPEDLSDEEAEFYEAEAWVLDDGEYIAESCLDSDILVIKSPFYTFAPFCSPCVPGAGNLDEACGSGVKTYCFGPDWYDSDDKPKFKIYSVETNALVYEPVEEELQ